MSRLQSLAADDSGYIGSPSALTPISITSNSQDNMVIMQKSHQFNESEDFCYFLTPIICQFCWDFIMVSSVASSNKKIGVKCEDCQKCFHTSCLQAYQNIPAYTKCATKSKFKKSHRLSGGGGHNAQEIIRTPDINSIENCSFYSTENNYVALNKYLPPEEWSPRFVTEWLVANNFADIIQHLENIDGRQLLDLDEEAIKPSTGGQTFSIHKFPGSRGAFIHSALHVTSGFIGHAASLSHSPVGSQSVNKWLKDFGKFRKNRRVL